MLALRRRFRVTLLVVAGAAHVLGTVLFLHVFADELLAQLRLIHLLKSLSL